MSQAFAALLGAIVGALAAIIPGVLIESYKRHSERRGTASAIAGEISSIIATEQRRGTARIFAEIAKLPNETVARWLLTLGNFTHPEPKLDPIAQAHLQKLGLLDGDLPERIAIFYTYLIAIRFDLANIVKGGFNENVEGLKVLITGDVKLWAENVSAATVLCNDLKALAAEHWWLDPRRIKSILRKLSR